MSDCTKGIYSPSSELGIHSVLGTQQVVSRNTQQAQNLAEISFAFPALAEDLQLPVGLAASPLVFVGSEGSAEVAGLT